MKMLSPMMLSLFLASYVYTQMFNFRLDSFPLQNLSSADTLSTLVNTSL